MFPHPEIHIFLVWCVRFICDNLALPVPCHWERINTDEPYQVLHLLKWTSLLHSDGCDVAAHPAGTRHPRVQRGGPPVWKDHGSSHQIHPEDSELGFMGILLQVWVETLMSLLPGTSGLLKPWADCEVTCKLHICSSNTHTHTHLKVISCSLLLSLGRRLSCRKSSAL